MEKNASQRVVDFISNLTPLYMHEKYNELFCARAVSDGTLIVPVIDDLDEDDTVFVKVYWQGDSTRFSLVRGVAIAHLAIARYAEIHAIPQAIIGPTKEEFQHIAHHFEVKTGLSLILD